MNYINVDEVKKNIETHDSAKQFLASMQSEVDTYFTNFVDSPEKISEWGHHYFCSVDGELLIYDPNKPTEHVCSLCGKVHSTELLNGVWVTMYRNEGAVNAWKSAVVYNITKEKKYLDNVIEYAKYYSDNYLSFNLHEKNGLMFDNLEDCVWGAGRIMPQSLNESIFIIRLINALELVKNDLPKGFVTELGEKFFEPAYELLKPQVDRIHNISCWLNSGIAIMGLFLNNKEMLDFAFEGEFNINRQLDEGVTIDKFWYEGSIHYNFFTLDSIVNLLLFSKVYDYDFEVGFKTCEEMLIQAYRYAFDNHQLPNPNDGWPNINLKTYSHIYAMSIKVFGEESKIANILNNILNKDSIRGQLPLSKPYYFENNISLEEFLFCPLLRDKKMPIVEKESINFVSSHMGLIKDENKNIFIKYGHHGPSHAHPDKMNIEVILDNICLSRDLSNSGYGNQLCNEWHRMSPSHNTVVINGENHTSMEGGICLEESDTHLKVKTPDVYDGVDFIRTVALTTHGFEDVFEVNADEEKVIDFFFHVEGNLISDVKYGDLELGNDSNGYQHLHELKNIVVDSDEMILKWDVKGLILESKIGMNNKELFIASTPDNPVSGYRTTIIIREKNSKTQFDMSWKVEE